jgi:hypothetical protein
MIKFTHFYKGFGIHSSFCQVSIKRGNPNLILFTDLNHGTSVTNASEQLASDIIKLYELNPQECRFFETYSQYDDSTVDEIIYDWDGLKPKNPSWKPCDDKKILKIFKK